MFVPGTELIFKTDYSKEIIDYNIYLFTSTSLYTSISYSLAFIFVIYLIIIERKQLKNEGWLFMSIILFIISSPIIFYNIYLDFGLSRALFYSDFSFLDTQDTTGIVFQRFKNTTNTVLSGLAYLANVNAIAYYIFKPLIVENNSNINHEIN